MEIAVKQRQKLLNWIKYALMQEMLIVSAFKLNQIKNTQMQEMKSWGRSVGGCVTN